jgi:flavin-dependent dehydrogenase
MGLVPPEFPKVAGFRIVARNGDSVEVDFPGRPGLAVWRQRFDAWLLDRAREAGATVHEGATMPHGTESRWLVAADGLHSRFGDGSPDAPLRIGFSTHARGIDVGDRVEIRFQKDGEIYLTPSGPHTNVAVLGRASRLRGAPGEAVVARLLGQPSIEATTPVLGMGPLGRRVSSVVSGNTILIGDAAGAPDPITGEGMALALRSALVAADGIARGDLSGYASWRLLEGRSARLLGRRLLQLSRFSGRVVRNLKRQPELGTRMMRVVAGEASVASLTIGFYLGILRP